MKEKKMFSINEKSPGQLQDSVVVCQSTGLLADSVPLLLVSPLPTMSLAAHISLSNAKCYLKLLPAGALNVTSLYL